MADQSKDKNQNLNQKILIVGAGCFGASTAYHLLLRGYTDVTIVERSPVLPAPDAASNDINRVVRSSYSDKFYTQLAREAILSWKDKEKWGDAYHESGVLVLGSSAGIQQEEFVKSNEQGASSANGNEVASQLLSSYADAAYKNDIETGAIVEILSDSGSIRSALPSGVRTGQAFAAMDQSRGGTLSTVYLNRDGGWANARQGLERLISLVQSHGGKFLTGTKVIGFVRNDDSDEQSKVIGVEVLVHHSGDGVQASSLSGGPVSLVERGGRTCVYADQVIVATGSWTPSAFPGLGLEQVCLATGQCIAMIQLTEEEAAVYRDCPVVLDFVSGFYMFPPNGDNVIKLAIHSAGYTHLVEGTSKGNTPGADAVVPTSLVSTPRTVTSNPTDGLAIPRAALVDLRARLKEVYPELALKSFAGTRLCWYNDTPDDDWIISRHPVDHNILIATGGSGHAYKFLPVIGRLIADLVEDTMPPDLVAKFSMDRTIQPNIPWRGTGQKPQPLREEDLSTKEDWVYIGA